MNEPNTFESVVPCSGKYSWKKDLRLNAWCFVATVVYLVALYLRQENPGWSPLARGLLALSPMVPGVLYVRSIMRFVRGMDELQRRIQLEALLFAALGTLFIGTIINTLNANGVSLGKLQHGLGLGSAFLVMFFLWLAGTAIANRRFK